MQAETVTYITGIPRLTVSLKKEIINGRPWSPRIQRFDEQGYLRISRSQEYGDKIIELLDKDSRNPDLFRRLTDEERAVIADVNREPVAHMPDGGVTEDDLEMLRYLEDKTGKDVLVTTETKKTIQVINKVMGRFVIHGIPPATESCTLRKLKSIIFDVFDVLDNTGIYPAAK